MKIWALAGKLLRFSKTEEELEQFGPPDVYDDEIEFDGDTNQDVIDGLDGKLPGVLWQDHTLSGGVLHQHGIPITINPPGQHFLDRATVKEFWNDLGNGIDWLEAHRQTWQSLSDAWDGLTPTQKQTQLLNNFGVLLGDFSALLYINYRVLIFIRWLIKALKLLVSL